tara:strand:+ start:811 stop:1386 length:576 start_codon:yes stop_codon:yes gene_type:complete
MTPDKILGFWLDETDSKQWYNSSKKLDSVILREFYPTWVSIMDGKFGMWLTYPSGSLAYILVLDQFSRNMFRGSSKAFSSDYVALAAAKQAIKHKFDLAIDEPGRQFFYLPLMHSESLQDQERCIRLMHERMPVEGMNNLLHARAHREVIRKFGRFPTRNEALSRRNTALEADYMKNGGYGITYTQLANSA